MYTVHRRYEETIKQNNITKRVVFTEFLQDISKSFDQGEGIPVDTLLIVYLLFAEELVLFFRLCKWIAKATNCSV